MVLVLLVTASGSSQTGGKALATDLVTFSNDTSEGDVETVAAL